MLSKRLQTILDLIDVHDCVADIGTDHGYLLIGALNKGLKFVQGIDNKEGPYKTCLNNLSSYVEEGKALITLSDGLTNLASNIDTVVIAGMGGELISQIISDSFNEAKKLKKLILQPNLRTFELRQFLSENGFQITDEKIVSDASKYYEIICTKFIGKKIDYSYEELLFGPILLKEKNSLFLEKWTKKKIDYENILSNNTSNQELSKIKNLLSLITEVLK